MATLAKTETQTEQASERPDGSKPIALGWLSLVAALILLLLSMGMGPSDTQAHLAKWSSYGSEYAGTVAAAYAKQFLMQIAAGGFFSLFLVLWSVGYVVRAISFLPGRN